jgi:hypothetical protein
LSHAGRDNRPFGVSPLGSTINAEEVPKVPALSDITQRTLDIWNRALETALEDSIADLSEVIFSERWPDIRREAESDEAAVRLSLRYYERGLADLFALLRAAGRFPNPLAWSTFKADQRRRARDAGVEISLRTALDEALYVAETIELRPHATYLAWIDALTHFLASRADEPAPPDTASDDARIAWALTQLAPLEDHQRFHAEFTTFVSASLAEPGKGDVLALQQRLLLQPRFDLVLNAALRWLAVAQGDLIEVLRGPSA